MITPAFMNAQNGNYSSVRIIEETKTIQEESKAAQSGELSIRDPYKDTKPIHLQDQKEMTINENASHQNPFSTMASPASVQNIHHNSSLQAPSISLRRPKMTLAQNYDDDDDEDVGVRENDRIRNDQDLLVNQEDLDQTG